MFVLIICILGFLVGVLLLLMGNETEKLQAWSVLSTSIITIMLAGCAYVLTEIAEAVTVAKQ